MNKKKKPRISEIRRRAKYGGEGYFTPGGMNRTLASLDIDVLLERIDDLEMWIHSEEDRVDVCTFSVFGELCDGCRCGRRNSLHNVKSDGTAGDGTTDHG